MTLKITQGDAFPDITLDLTDGTRIELPDRAPTRNVVLLFYRGEW